MGGGCSSPVGAEATVDGTQLRLRAVSFLNDTVQHAEQAGDLREPEALGAAVAAELCG
jgi:porphobilinogen deaminase